jgi:uncharacterized protein with HEPN domain
MGIIMATNIEIPMVKIAAFCQRYQIRELALFGSVLRDDSGRVSPDLRSRYPEIEWPKIVGRRNIMIHSYMIAQEFGSSK